MLVRLCFCMHYFVYFYFCNNFDEEEIAGWFAFVVSLDVLSLYMFCGSSSRLVCSLRLWYFLIILTYFFLFR